jgi:phospholipase/carboxylesterase
MASDTPTDTLPYIEANPGEPPRAAVIWLHGLGADGYDFEPLVPQVQPQLTVPTRFIFPHAPQRPVTINNGYVMRAWYDIAAFDLSRAEDTDGIRASARQLDLLIQREIDNGIAARRIVLAGFSQGGAVALHTGLRYPQRLAGILALSTYLPLAATVGPERHPANGDVPIFMGHGSEDTVVPLPHALASKQILQELGYRVEWHCYAMPHSLCNEEVDDIIAWLIRATAD